MDAFGREAIRQRLLDRDRLVGQVEKLVVDAMRLAEFVVRRVDQRLQTEIASRVAASNPRSAEVERETLARLAAGEPLKGVNANDLLERWRKEHTA